MLHMIGPGAESLNPVLRIGIGSPASIDPAVCFDHNGAVVLQVLADPLVNYIPATGHLHPAAAESWEVAPDGMRVVFALRRNVRFHHGREVTADDYVFSLSRVVRPQTDSEIAYYLSMIDGYDDVRDGQSDTLRGVRALERYRLEIQLRQPFHEVSALFCHRVTAPVPRELCESDPELFRLQPVSTGPYRLIRPWTQERCIALERFVDYYDYCATNAASPSGGIAQVSRLDFVVLDNSDHAYRAWTDGFLDVLELPESHVVDEEAMRESYYQTPCAVLAYLAFPVRIFPFDDPIVRRAIAMSINRERLCGQIRRNRLAPADRVVPPPLANDDRTLLNIPYDPELARRMLAEKNMLKRITVSVVFDGDNGNNDWVDQLAADLMENIGWHLEVRPMPRAQYLQWLTEPDALFRANWMSDYPSVDSFMSPLFHSASVGNGNYSGYSNRSVDALIDAARATRDASERHELYVSAEQEVCDDLPILPLWFGVHRHLINTKKFDLDGPPIDTFGGPSPRVFRVRNSGTGEP